MFFGSSIICAEAKNMQMLIIGRSLQGTAGGGMVQLVMITISDIFSIRSVIYHSYSRNMCSH
jgi:MFS family permease